MAQGPVTPVMALSCSWMVWGGRSSPELFYPVQELIPSPRVGVNAASGPGCKGLGHFPRGGDEIKPEPGPWR